MQYYMAPLEGITTHVFRTAYSRFYPACDKYFTPFLASKKLSSKEQKEILPENNVGMQVVPQILTNQTEVFLEIARQVGEYGYDTVNLNLGCPSGTVVAKKRGAGQLDDPYALDRFLDDIFEKCPLKISVKTRIGMEFESEWEDLLKVFQKYPLEELVIHPRLREDYYQGKPRLGAYMEAVKAELPFPICYNGDIVSAESLQKIREQIGTPERIMIGRGFLRNPGILEEIVVESSGESKGTRGVDSGKLRDFLLKLAAGYEELYGPKQDKNVLFKVKDIWNFLGAEYPNREKELKAIRKVDTVAEYRILVKRFFND